MKNRKLALVLTTVVVLLSLLLTGGCMGGISQEQYDRAMAQFNDAVAKINEAQSKVADLQAEKQTAEAALKDAQSKVAALEGQVGSLKEKYELVGATPAETAEKIVRYYHEIHVYSTYDLYVCSDMASDVWNMLKAHGIKARIAVGSKNVVVNDILQSDHAWVLAEVNPGEYLALETTAGFVVPESKNPLYYRGWYFDNPAELKSYQKLREEYNIRVAIHNDIVAEDKGVVAEHNRATNQAAADRLKAVHDKLVEILQKQEAEMNDIMSNINSLATSCST